MDSRQTLRTTRKGISSLTLHGLSRRSGLIGVVFLATLAAAFFVDADAVLKYLSIIAGPPGTAMEIGAFATAATVLPLLAMGMSINDDEMRREL
jgi:hypothetical protein